jgi:hypothetical protein
LKNLNSLSDMSDNGIRAKRLSRDLKIVRGDSCNFIEFVQLTDGDLSRWQVGIYLKKNIVFI